jgi:hypothetical protein
MKINLINIWRNVKWVLGGLALAVSFTSCLDNDNTTVQPVPVALVSIYNASPDSPGLDVILDNKQINSQSFDYSDYTGYLRFYTGDRNLKLNPVNASNTLVDTTLALEAGKAYSIFTIKEVSGIGTLIVEDSIGNLLPDQAKVRFINLSPDAAAIDVAIAGGSTLFTGGDFKEVIPFKDVTPGTYNLEIKSGAQTLTIPNANLRAGSVYTIITRGFKNPPAGNTNVLSAEVINN